MIDDQGKRLSALRNRIPSSVLFTLFAIAVAACAFAGYASGLDAQRTRNQSTSWDCSYLCHIPYYRS